MDEMTLVSMNIYHIDENHFKYEKIWQNMQEKISDISLRFGSKYPSLENPPMGGGPFWMYFLVRTATYDIYYHSKVFISLIFNRTIIMFQIFWTQYNKLPSI
jgi:hypothetical protein